MNPFPPYPGACVSTPPGTGGGGGGGGIVTPTRLVGVGTLTNAQTNVFSNGITSVTLPGAPVDGQTVSFFDNTLTWNTAPLTINANAGQTISSLSLPASSPGYYGPSALATVQGGRVTFMFDATLNRWST